jgi:hypothetical protein
MATKLLGDDVLTQLLLDAALVILRNLNNAVDIAFDV